MGARYKTGIESTVSEKEPVKEELEEKLEKVEEVEIPFDQKPAGRAAAR